MSATIRQTAVLVRATGGTAGAAAADGLLPWRTRPEVLKRATVARLPPADMPGDEVEP
jgi:predicted metal-binding protein